MRYLVLIPALLLSAFSQAEWTLQPSSSLTFLTTKNTHLTEVHQFRSIRGKVSDQGMAELSIDLTSIDSGIPIRDTRMQEWLFETNRFSHATFNAVVPVDVLNKASGGDSQTLTLKGKLMLHGHEEDISVPVSIVPAQDKSVVITSLQPVLLHADSFALTAGIQKLRDIAKLERIAEVVPVSFSLTFRS
ncbi:MAG: YceI family protein [Saccharospirillaceae bacterium]|nr:YceI family protein [Saccharospirillaceae bacterium]MCD8532592.1 YceI family protein [Saccharospirillaceae bacterium]